MSLQVLVSSPPGFPAAGIVRAAHHAGAIGMLALEYADGAESRRVLESLIASDVQFMVSVRGLDAAERERVARAAGRGLAGVVISDPRDSRLRDDVQWILDAGVRAVVEVTSVEQAVRAEAAGATDLIVKGNESGGLVGEETTLILLQRVLPKVSLPVFARGGIGLRSSAACLAAGVAGVVLDWQLALCDESDVPEEIRARIARMDGSETAIIGQSCGVRFRVGAGLAETAYLDLRTRDERDGPQARKRVLQQLQPLAGQVLAARDEPRRIAGRSRDARDEALEHRVARDHEHDRCTGRRDFRRLRRLGRRRDDQVDLFVRELDGERSQPLGLRARRPPQDAQVATDGIPLRLHRLDEVAEQRLAVAFLDALEVADAGVRPRRGEARSGKRAGESRQHEPAAVAARRWTVPKHGLPNPSRRER